MWLMNLDFAGGGEPVATGTTAAGYNLAAKRRGTNMRNAVSQIVMAVFLGR